MYRILVMAKLANYASKLLLAGMVDLSLIGTAVPDLLLVVEAHAPPWMELGYVAAECLRFVKGPLAEFAFEELSFLTVLSWFGLKCSGLFSASILRIPVDDDLQRPLLA